MTVTVIATFHPRENARQALIDALVSTIPAVHAEPGCQLYAIHDAPDGSIVMIEKWDSAELLDAHAAGSAVAALGAATKPHLAAPADVVRMTPIPAGTVQQGLI